MGNPARFLGPCINSGQETSKGERRSTSSLEDVAFLDLHRVSNVNYTGQKSTYQQYGGFMWANDLDWRVAEKMGLPGKINTAGRLATTVRYYGPSVGVNSTSRGDLHAQGLTKGQDPSGMPSMTILYNEPVSATTSLPNPSRHMGTGPADAHSKSNFEQETMKPGEMQRRGIQKPESHDRIFPGFLFNHVLAGWDEAPLAYENEKGRDQAGRRRLRFAGPLCGTAQTADARRLDPCGQSFANTFGVERVHDHFPSDAR